MRSLLLSAISAAAIAGCGAHSPDALPAPSFPVSLSLGAEFIVRSADPKFGGISGMVLLSDGRELLAVSDDRENSRIVRLRIIEAPAWRIEPVGTIPLETGTGAPTKMDPEGIALTPEGHILISSEGIGDEEPRLPPSIIEYAPDGRFIRQLPVRARYSPNARGPLVTGVRANAGFESLTTSPDFARLFTATELPLAQDGEADPFVRGGRSRILEYVRRDATYRPEREFAYEIEALEKPGYPVRFAINGLVELLALSRTELLALERGYVESEDRTASMNRVLIFRISLEGASDVSGFETLRDAAGIAPVRKTLLADLNALAGLSPPLRYLDNFEGLAWGPRSADGSRALIVVSDDNFNERQVTAFLLLRPGRP